MTPVHSVLQPGLYIFAAKYPAKSNDTIKEIQEVINMRLKNFTIDKELF